MRQSTTTDRFGFTEFIVSLYLIFGGIWLLATGRLKSSIFGKIIRSKLRGPYAGPVGQSVPDQGYCFKATLPAKLLSDLESASRVRLYEDGVELGPAHSPHEQIRRLGHGRFSHWGADLYYATSDNSDPRTNGRRYEIRETA